ncbi:phosphodiesterase [Phaeobacter inhibens]|uniref:phosphodiesterase n=1 Tax=Phaeobacter inhibens TaxID=221822 RepID=UPI0001632F91|nr:phosphodiesterase [Phaeobacter inhibens]AFO92735.1 phosphoesterase-like protein [Phaeobacter inhibens DSM 17395]AUQ47439.1 phosphoesterase-like protein [Phaeobacter inhibens]AXT24042.1 phosphodiesterase [Phaeobacter inhibens]
MKIIHISDIHLTIPGEEMGGLDPHARFSRALANVAENHANADRIVITGDLTHWGEVAAYEALKSALAEVSIPVRLLIGNHDDRDTFRKVFTDHPVDANGFVNHAETLDETRLIYLDSVGDKTHAGHFCAVRRDWLKAELTAAGRARIFLHHNPMPVGLPAEDKIALVPEDRAAFKALLEAYGDRIDYIHFGHVHAPIHGRFAGIPFASVPSTGNQSLPDLNETELLKGAPMAPAYFVLSIDGNDTTIHQIPFAWDGPVMTSGTGWEDWAKPGVAAE